MTINLFIIPCEENITQAKILFAKSLTPHFKGAIFVVLKFQNGFVKTHTHTHIQTLYKSHNILEISLKITGNNHIFTKFFYSRRKQEAFRVVLFVISFT